MAAAGVDTLLPRSAPGRCSPGWSSGSLRARRRRRWARPRTSRRSPSIDTRCASAPCLPSSAAEGRRGADIEDVPTERQVTLMFDLTGKKGPRHRRHRRPGRCHRARRCTRRAPPWRCRAPGSRPWRRWPRELGSDRVHVHRRPTSSEKDAVDALVPAAEAALGGLDILVNNAGITRDNLFMRMKDDEWDAGHRGEPHRRLPALARGREGHDAPAPAGASSTSARWSARRAIRDRRNYAAAKAGLVGPDQGARGGSRLAQHHRELHQRRASSPRR